MRWMWNHNANTDSSGTPRCTNTSSEKRRSLSAAALRKLRVNGAANKGNQSSHSAVASAENWPSWSQFNQKPPIALMKTSSSKGTPVSHKKRRKPL